MVGIVQGYVIFTNQTTIDDERDFSKELFHEAFKLPPLESGGF